MMPTGAQLLASAYRFRGEPYSTAPGRTSQTSGYKDCSGLVYASLVGVGITPGGMVSTTLETWAVNNGGRRITASEAMRTPGAGIAIWGVGSAGHIGLSVGDNSRAFETPSDEGRRVGYSRFWRNRWTRFFTWPGIDHHGPVAAPAPLYQGDENEMGNAIYSDGHLHVFWIDGQGRPQERWGHPNQQSISQVPLKSLDAYPLKPRGDVSVARNPAKANDYAVTFERDDGSTRVAHRIDGKWITE